MTILPDRADERVDACIARLAPGISRSAAQRLCEDGQVLLNGAAAKKNARVAPGDVLELSCTLVEQRGGVGFGKAEARVAGKLACQAELTFAVG